MKNEGINLSNQQNHMKNKSKKMRKKQKKRTKKQLPITLNNLSRHFQNQMNSQIASQEKPLILITKTKKGGINVAPFKLKFQKEFQKLKQMEKQNNKSFLELKKNVDDSEFSSIMAKDIIKGLHSFVSEKEFEKFVIKKMLVDGNIKINF